MQQLLTNSLAGYDPHERTQSEPGELFRLMALMAIAEGQTLAVISPRNAAQIMTYNPGRADAQIYMATLGSCVIDREGETVRFSIIARYIPFSGGQKYVYYNGRMTPITINGDERNIEVSDWYSEFAAAEERNIIDDVASIRAHLLSIPEIDYGLDWGPKISITTIPAGSASFRDIDARVKSGARGDSYPLWREINPTGIRAEYSNVTGKTEIQFDTGIVCSSVLSSHAPEYLMVSMSDHYARIYLNIDEIPMPVLPEYKMHPGQYLYDRTLTYDVEGTAEINGGDYTITLEGDHIATLADGLPITIFRRGVRYSASIVASGYTAPNTTIIIAETDIPAGDIMVRYMEETYIDGDLFGGNDAELYRTPKSARMFILRAVLEYGELPYLPDNLGMLQTVNSVGYRYRQNDDYDGLYATYANCHYEVNEGSKTYQETGDISYDTVETMRYTGHYGRNPQYAYRINGDIDLDFVDGENSHYLCQIPIFNRDRKEIVAVEQGLIVSKNTVEIDIDLIRGVRSPIIDARAMTAEDETFYYYYSNIRESASISNIMFAKIYITNKYVQSNAIMGKIYAYITPGGYSLAMLEGEDGDRTLTTDLEMAEDTMYLSRSVLHPNTRYMLKIGNEIVVGKSSADGSSITGLSRGLYGTRVSRYNAGVMVAPFNPYFHNSYMGYVVSADAGNIRIQYREDMVISDYGYIRIGSEIMEYGSYNTHLGQQYIDLEIISRSSFGSEPVDVKKGMEAVCVAYFSYGDIHPTSSNYCDYNGKYRSKLTLPISNPDDPVRYGAKAVYLMELSYETSQKNKTWQ